MILLKKQETDRVTSFDSDGFTLGSSAGVNQNGANLCIMELVSKWCRCS
jgi:hypothetical protein